MTQVEYGRLLRAWGRQARHLSVGVIFQPIWSLSGLTVHLCSANSLDTQACRLPPISVVPGERFRVWLFLMENSSLTLRTEYQPLKEAWKTLVGGGGGGEGGKKYLGEWRVENEGGK